MRGWMSVWVAVCLCGAIGAWAAEATAAEAPAAKEKAAEPVVPAPAKKAAPAEKPSPEKPLEVAPAPEVPAPAPAAEKTLTVKGMVKVLRDREGNIRSVRVKPVDELSVKIVLDEAGLKVAQQEGKKVEVTGPETVKDGLKMLTVKSCTKIEEK